LIHYSLFSHFLFSNISDSLIFDPNNRNNRRFGSSLYILFFNLLFSLHLASLHFFFNRKSHWSSCPLPCLLSRSKSVQFYSHRRRFCDSIRHFRSERRMKGESFMKILILFLILYNVSLICMESVLIWASTMHPDWFVPFAMFSTF
jgi:hypothetical protein